MQVQPDVGFYGYRASVQVDNWRAHVESSDIRVDLHCYLHLYITKYFFLTFIVHCHWWTTHPLNHISTYVQEQMPLHLSLQGWCRGFLFTPGIFVLARFAPLLFYTDVLPLYVFTLCFALVLREKGWLIGGDRWLFKFGLEPIPPLVLQLKVGGGGRVKGVVPSPRGTNHSGRQAKHLSCRALIKDLAMYLPYFFTTFIQE